MSEVFGKDSKNGFDPGSSFPWVMGLRLMERNLTSFPPWMVRYPIGKRVGRRYCTDARGGVRYFTNQSQSKEIVVGFSERSVEEMLGELLKLIPLQTPVDRSLYRVHAQQKPSWVPETQVFLKDPWVPEGFQIWVPSGEEVGAIWLVGNRVAFTVYDPDHFFLSCG